MVSLIRSSKHAFFNSLVTSDKRKFWKMVKQISKQKPTIPTFISNNSIASTDLEKANLLIEQFFSNFNKAIFTSPTILPDHELTPDNFPEELLLTDDKVFELICGLDVNKSTGLDDVSARMLKATASSFTPILTLLLNRFLKKGDIPRDWKIARVVA